MAYRVMVGTYGDWHALPSGTEWLGWNQKRREKLVKVPLGNGAVDVSDGLWEPMKVRLRISLPSDSPAHLETDIVTVYNLLMQYQTAGSGTCYYVAVENRGASTSMEFLVQYDRIVGMDVVMSKGTRHRHCFATFTLSCNTSPYMNRTQDFDG